MNKSPVRVLGTILKIVEIEGIKIKLHFLIVPSETMTCVALFGRDFSRNPSIKVELGETVNVIKRYASSNEINQIMRIEYLETPRISRNTVKIGNELNINLDVKSEIVAKV